MDSSCPNCDGPAAESYCPRCGQSTREVRAPLRTIVADFATELLSLDGRHLRSVALLGRPGRLTRLYQEGKRASHVRPVRLYFVASLLFFMFVGFPAMKAEEYNVYVGDILIGRAVPDPEANNLRLSSMEGPPGEDRALRSSKMRELQEMPAQQLLDRFVAGLERTVPVALIFFVPILAAGLKLLYLRQPFFYVDHLVFALHFQSFLFVLLLLVRLLNAVAPETGLPAIVPYLAAIFLILPVYMMMALRRVYAQSWAWTIWKGVCVGILYLLIVQPVMGITMLLVIRSI